MNISYIDNVPNIKVAVSDVYGDFTYEDVYLRSWDLAKGILGLLGQVCLPGTFLLLQDLKLLQVKTDVQRQLT